MINYITEYWRWFEKYLPEVVHDLKYNKPEENLHSTNVLGKNLLTIYLM
jgi:hypothetical protein